MRNRAERAAWAALAAYAAVQLWFFALKRVPEYWDEGLYLRAAAELGGDPSRAPLLGWLTAPFFALGAPFWVNVIAIAVLLGCALALGGPLAAWACAAAPLLLGLSRLLLVEYWLAAALCLHLMIMSRTLQRLSVSSGLALGACWGAGLMLKTSYPIYAAAPAMLHLWSARRSGAKPFLAMAAAAAVLAGPWYFLHGRAALEWALRAGYGDVSADFAVALPGYWLDCAVYGLSIPTLLVLLLNRRGGEDRALLLSAAVVPLLVFSTGTNRELRFLAPSVAAAAILAGRAAAALPAPAALAWVLSGLFAFQLPASVDRAYRLRPDTHAKWDYGALVERLREREVVGVATVHYAFYPETLTALSRRRGYKTRFVHLGYPQPPSFTAERAMANAARKGASCLIFAEGLPANELPPFFNRAEPQLKRRLAPRERVEIGPGTAALLTEGC